MLENELQEKLHGRVVIVGVGNESRGDDAAGPRVARLLMDGGLDTVVDSGTSPELDTWKIREFAPDTVLFVDAVDFGGSPGDTALVERTSLNAVGFDTHRAPLRLTMQYLEESMRCKCYLLSIQPACIREGATMCREVDRAVKLAAEALLRCASVHAG